MVDFVSAIKKGFEDPLTLAVGSLINFVPLLGSIVTSGIAGKTAQNTMGGKDNLAKINDNTVDILLKGVFLCVIQLIYLLPATIILCIGAVVALGPLVMSLLSGSYSEASIMAALAGAGVGVLIILFGILVALLSSLIGLGGTLNYLKSNNFGDAFKIGEAVKIGLSIKMIITSIILFVITVALLIPTIILSMIPVVGFLFFYIFAYVANITAYSAYAQAYNEMKK